MNKQAQQRAIIKKREREPKVKCRIPGCLCMLPSSTKTGLCSEHWRKRKKLKSSGYYEGS